MKPGKLAVIIFLLLSCKKTFAQVPVAEEPHHKVIFENAIVRILDLHIKSGDTALSHTHSNASIVIFLSASVFGIQNHGEQPVVSAVKPGATVYRSYDEKPVEHIVWNQSQSAFRCLVIELKTNTQGNATCTANDPANAKFLWEQKKVKAYRLVLPAKKHFSLPPSRCSYILISVSGNTILTRTGQQLKTGDFHFFSAGNEVQMKNQSLGNAVSVLLEIH